MPRAPQLHSIDEGVFEMILPNALVTGDVHLRDGPYPDDIKLGTTLLTDLKDAALASDCKYVIIAGDFFHSKNPSWDVVLMGYLGMLEMKKAGLTVFWCRGNHDFAIKSRPGHTVMSLFRDVCIPVLEPYKLEDKSTVAWIVPWYEGKAYRAIIREVHRQTMSKSGKKHYLISHIGIKEGEVTENFWVNQEIGSKDLCPDLYTQILLGDYHYAQTIGHNIHYLGPPMPLDFTTTQDVYHPWKLDWVAGALTPVPLSYRYPRYRHYILAEGESVIPGYSGRDRNRVTVCIDRADTAKVLYPDAEILYTAKEEATLDRLEGVNETDWETTWAEYCSSKGVYETHFKPGREFLLKAE